MNCCDDYGNCRQGRDCPVRIACSLQPSTFKRLFRRFFYGLFIAILGMMWLALLVAYAYAYTN
jgi:hypothetical protein